MQHSPSSLNSPGTSLLILVGFVFLGALVFQILALVMYFVSFGSAKDLLGGGLERLTSGQSEPAFMYLMLASSSIGTFLFPPLMLQWVERKSGHQYLPLSKKTPIIFYLLAALFLIAANPLLGLIAEWNMHMQLPDSWSSLQDWMRLKEDQMAQLTERMVMHDSLALLPLNLLVLAVIPAIAEEFFFRGALQHIIGGWVNNKHVVIWLTAIIFSAIHVQFFGFIPRMLLGAIFGYMLVFTGTLWVPVLAHFINNAGVVLVAFYYARKGSTYAELMSNSTYHIGLYFVSLVVSIALGWYFYTLSSTKHTNTWNQAG